MFWHGLTSQSGKGGHFEKAGGQVGGGSPSVELHQPPFGFTPIFQLEQPLVTTLWNFAEDALWLHSLCCETRNPARAGS
jgi:hypothetical protein